MSLTAEQIQKNWDLHLKIVDKYIGDRKNDVNIMLEDLADTYVMAPASGKTWYHNAFPGGYVDHVNRVVQYAVKQSRLYEEMGGTIDFTMEELVFAGLFHDLGKIGTKDQASYLPQTDKWRQDKLAEMYTNNPELDFMLIPDRSLFVLQKFGIEVTKKEFLGIRLHDGVFDEANKAYFFSYNPSSRQKTNIIKVLHVADFLASQVEYDTVVGLQGYQQGKVKKTQSSTGKRVNASDGLAKTLKNL